jgi:endonuclease G
MDHAVRTVDEVERLTGMDFFHALPDEMEKKVEAEADLGKW